MARLSVSRAWEESKVVLVRDGRLLTAVALAFVAVPVMIGNFLAPDLTTGQAKPGAWLVVSVLVLVFAAVALVALSDLATRHGSSVAEAIRRALNRAPAVCGIGIGSLLLLSVVAVLLASSLMPNPTPIVAAEVIILLLLLLSPVLARLMIIPAMAAVETGGMIKLVGRDWALTKGNGLRLWGLFVLLFVTWFILELVFSVTFGALVRLAFGTPESGSVSKLVLAAVMGLLRSIEILFVALIYARIYAQLTGRDAEASVPNNGA